MANSLVDTDRHDSVYMYVSEETWMNLRAKCAPGQTVDELVDRVLSDDTKWPALVQRLHDRALHRDIFRVTDGWREPSAQDVTRSEVLCSCCKPAPCRCAFQWRGVTRCGCTPERVAYLNANGKSLL